MPEIEKVITVVSEWVKKAENDLKTAAYTLEMDDECPTDTVCFHAQQVVEKYLKALLVLNGIPFPKTHNIEDIMALLPPSSRPKLAEKDQDRLTEYATVTRYPGDYEPISLDEARKAVRIARGVRTHARKLLPKQALLRRRK
ncbi:MAG: HEPN domain-containing protein [Thermodesulfobacteriota bacterium]